MKYFDSDIRLIREIEKWNSYSFQWGKYDCCTFCASCIKAMSDKNVFPKIRYRSQGGAQRHIKALGGSLYKVMQNMFGMALHPSQAQIGDIVYHTFETGPCIGICMGKYSYFVSEPGLEKIETLKTSRAFKWEK